MSKTRPTATKAHLRGRAKRLPTNGSAPENGQAPPIHSTPEKPAFIVDDNGQTTHVLLPYAEYERLQEQLTLAEMAAVAIARIHDGKPEDFVDADDVAIEFARDEIVAARKKAKLTQKQLGEKIGMPQSQISRIERNPDRTHVRTLKKLAKALNVDVSVFLRRL